jgi:GTP cyclohydrolase I
LPEEVPGKHEVNRPRIEPAEREILFTLGEGSERNGILGTPERVADACACLFAGLGEDPARNLEIGFMEAVLAATEVTAQRCAFPEKLGHNLRGHESLDAEETHPCLTLLAQLLEKFGL